MKPNCRILFSLLIVLYFKDSQCTVLELDDRFHDAKKEGEWLVMFYAPWCGHCKQLEPTWMELGEAMRSELPVLVARLDCTKYSTLASEFGVRGFPTIKYITADREYEYRGARTKTEIIAFTRKARGPTTSDITSSSALATLQNNHDVFFLYVGEPDSALRESYDAAANQVFLTLNLYVALPNITPHIDSPTILVFKDGMNYEVPASLKSSKSQLLRWMLSEQKPDYSELSGLSYHTLKNTHKSFAIAVLPEDSNDQKLNEIAKEIAISRDKVFHPRFIHCWVKGTGIVNQITYDKIASPNVVVVNPETHEYHVLRDKESSKKIKKSEIEAFLHKIIEGKLTPLGGSGILQQLRRFFFDTTGSIVSFFKQSPIIASLVLGIPTFAITFLCYCLCTMEESAEDGGYGTDSENEDDYTREDSEIIPEYEGENPGVRRRIAENDPGDESDKDGAGDIVETDKDK